MKSLLAIALIAASLSSFAATSDTLLLKGTVGTDCSIAVAAEAKAQALDILNGETGTLVGKATEICNKKEGYTVTMKSINGDKLVNTKDATNVAAYTLSYSGSTFKAPGTAEGNTVKTVSSLAKKTTNQSEIKINLIGNADALEGIYTDTVTFTIAAQ